MIRVRVVGADQVTIYLDRTFGPAGMYGLMNYLGLISRGQQVKHFKDEKGPLGPWKPLAPSTVARRRKNTSGILKDTGRLMGSITMLTSAKQVEIGTNVFYGKYHQYGGTYRGRPHPPQRAFLGWHDQDVDELQAACVAYLGRAAA